MGFPDSSVGKESACNAGDLYLIPGLGRSPGERKDYPLQYSGLENSLDCIVHGVTKSRTQLSDFHTIHCVYIYYMYIKRDANEQLFKLHVQRCHPDSVHGGRIYPMEIRQHYKSGLN